MSIQLRHLDNGFFIITKKDAIRITIDRKLPRPGYESRCLLGNLECWLTRTPGYAYLGKFTVLHGDDVEGGWGNALHLAIHGFRTVGGGGPRSVSPYSLPHKVVVSNNGRYHEVIEVEV